MCKYYVMVQHAVHNMNIFPYLHFHIYAHCLYNASANISRSLRFSIWRSSWHSWIVVCIVQSTIFGGASTNHSCRCNRTMVWSSCRSGYVNSEICFTNSINIKLWRSDRIIGNCLLKCKIILLLYLYIKYKILWRCKIYAQSTDGWPLYYDRHFSWRKRLFGSINNY